MEKMETTARTVLMERQLLMHQQQLQHQDLQDHKVKRALPVRQVQQDLQGQLVQLDRKVQLELRDQVLEHLDRKARQVHKEQLVQQEVRELLDPLDQPVRLAQQEVQEQRDQLDQQVQQDLREFLM
jgi:hypothetical protein